MNTPSRRKLLAWTAGLPLALASRPVRAQRVLRLATLQGGSQPAYAGARRFAELVGERSGGEIEVRVFPDGQLGTEQESLEGVKLGTIDLFMGSTGAVGRFLPRLEAFSHPYLWRDTAHLLATVRGPLGQELSKQLVAAHCIRILDMGWVFGRRHLTTTKTPVTTPGDMAGLKIRVQPTKIYLATIQAMGGTPTPMDFKEVYTSLQTGVIDGQENPVNVLATRKFYEVQGYLMLTGHITQNQALVVGEQLYGSLSPEQRALLVQAARDAGDDQNRLLAKSEEADLALLRGNGMKVVEPDVAAFRAATADVHLAFDEQWGAGFFERLKSVQ